MIKQTIIFLIISFFVYTGVQGQDVDSSSVDIRVMLNKQISEIRAKQENNIILNTANQEVQAAGTISLDNTKLDSRIMDFIENDLVVKIYVLVEIIMLLGLIYISLTKVKRNKRKNIEVLKSNIVKLREERIGSINEINLSIVRARLSKVPIKIDDNGKDITFRARKNNIGKGEIHLAAKIQLLAGKFK